MLLCWCGCIYDLRGGSFLTVTERSLLFGRSLLLLSPLSAFAEDIDAVRLIGNALVCDLQVLVYVTTRIVVEENVGSYQFTSLLVLALGIYFGDGVICVGFAETVSGQTCWYFGAGDVILTTPKGILDLE